MGVPFKKKTELEDAQSVQWSTEVSASEILHSLPDAVFTTDRQMRINYFNRAAAAITGFRASEAIGMYCKDILKSSICETECPVKRALDSQQNIFNIESALTTIERVEIPILVSASLLVGSSGEVVGYMHVFRDISSIKKMLADLERSRNQLAETNKQLKQEIEERRRAEEQLRQSESKLNAMLESIGDHMSMMDEDLNIIWANDTAKRTFGHDIVGKKCYEAYHGRKEPCEPSPCLTLKAFQDGRVHEHHTEVIDKDGNAVYFHCTANVALRDKEGKPTAVIEISRDTTASKRAEKEKRKLEAQLYRAQRMESIGTLAGGVAHDFNNLLMGIQGYTSLILKDLDVTHPQYNWARRIEDQVKSGAELTRQLLGFARGGKYDVKPTDINELMRKSSSMFGRTRKEITIKAEYEQNIWTVEVDQGQIEQILLNLYVNAWQAMPAGGDLYLETNNLTLDEAFTKPYHLQPGRYVRISVTDTGTGMDEATQQRIFDPFFTTKQMVRGAGLGLASAYGIIRNHDGIINVYSKKGHGSIFNIYLPAVESVVQDARPVVEDELIKRGTETILLVDDEQVVLDVGKELLRELGYTVLEARGGREAVEIYEENKGKIDLVLLDMVMPLMGGGEAHDMMKEINPDVKILLSSGYSKDGQATEILERGCSGFIQKPFNMKELSGKIREILDKE
jgi:PAS domain S-box-containing protein